MCQICGLNDYLSPDVVSQSLSVKFPLWVVYRCLDSRSEGLFSLKGMLVISTWASYFGQGTDP